MKVASQQAYDWVEELVPNTWIKAFFGEFPKCDMLLNNHCEVFNRYYCNAHGFIHFILSSEFLANIFWLLPK
jgi:hypothetical protein